jgi:hypothetical protein
MYSLNEWKKPDFDVVIKFSSLEKREIIDECSHYIGDKTLKKHMAFSGISYAFQLSSLLNTKPNNI